MDSSVLDLDHKDLSGLFKRLTRLRSHCQHQHELVFLFTARGLKLKAKCYNASVNIIKKAQQVYCKDRAAWRAWLGKHYGQKEGVWLVCDKGGSSERALTYNAIVEEALCFGWIDSKSGRVSATQAKIWVAPRNPKSNWSKSNRERVAELIKAKKMQSSGLTLVQLAKKTGTWTALVDVQNSVVPPDLQKEFTKSKKAWENFEKFPPSSKRIILEWILNAKKPETRKARITQTVELAAKNIKANHYRQ